MKNYSYVLKSNVRKEKIPLVTIFTDTETRNSEMYGNQQDMDFILGCYTVWENDDLGCRVNQIGKGAYYDISGFYDLLETYVDRLRKCRVVVHNWDFDATVLLIGSDENMKKYGYIIDVGKSILPGPGQGYAPFFILLQFNDGREIELQCNTNYYHCKLSVIGKETGNYKGEMPNEEIYKGDWNAFVADLLEYCYQDVLILENAYFATMEYIAAKSGVAAGLTSASNSMRIYRTSYYDNNIKAQGTLGIPYVSRCEEKGYHGGRTDTFFYGCPGDKTLYKYDVNSLYPYCMMGLMPVRYQQKVPYPLAKHYMEKSNEYIFLFEVDLSIDAESELRFLGFDAMPIDGRGLCFPAGDFTTFLWQPLFQIAARNGFVEKIRNCFMYRAAVMFDGFVMDMYNKRLEHKSKGENVLAQQTKIVLNSLYGKFVQRENAKWDELTEKDYEYEIMLRNNEKNIERFDEEYDGVKKAYCQIGKRLWAMDLRKRGLARTAICSIGGYITAKGRAMLYDAMAMVIQNGGTLYMCDTDSILTDMELPEHMISNTEIGKWKLEKTTDGKKAFIRCPKDYRLDDEYKKKGIRNPMDGNDDDGWEQVVFPRFTTDFTSTSQKRRDRLNNGAVLRHIVKKPTGKNLKRNEQGENMATLPLVIQRAMV